MLPTHTSLCAEVWQLACSDQAKLCEAKITVVCKIARGMQVVYYRLQMVSHGLCGCLQRRMTLLLGPPGAGKSTLLKALSGKLTGLKVQVLVTHNFGYSLHG